MTRDFRKALVTLECSECGSRMKKAVDSFGQSLRLVCPGCRSRLCVSSQEVSAAVRRVEVALAAAEESRAKNRDTHAVSEPPIRSSIPPRCLFCEAVGTVTLESRVRGNAVVICSCCRECGRDWPVKPHDRQPGDRRIGPADRRRKTRADRRANE